MSSRKQPEHLKRAQEEQARKRRIPRERLTKEQIWEKYQDRLRDGGLNKNSTKRAMLNELLKDNPQWQEYMRKVNEREKKAAEFQKAYSKDFNTAIAILQSEDSSIPRMRPLTKGGPMKVSYLRYCGSGKKIEYDPDTGTWSCRKDSASEKNKRFQSNYGEVTKTSLRERSLSELSEIAKDMGITFEPYRPSRDQNLTKEERSKLNAAERNSKKTELVKMIADRINSRKKEIYEKRKSQEDRKKQQAKKRRAENPKESSSKRSKK